MTITVASFTQILNHAVKDAVAKVIEKKVAEIEAEVKKEADKIAMGILREYDITMSNERVVITVRKI